MMAIADEISITPSAPIDYRLLLLKYIAHIGEEESITYINRVPVGGVFSQEERDELVELGEESRQFSERLRVEKWGDK